MAKPRADSAATVALSGVVTRTPGGRPCFPEDCRAQSTRSGKNHEAEEFLRASMSSCLTGGLQDTGRSSSDDDDSRIARP